VILENAVEFDQEGMLMGVSCLSTTHLGWHNPPIPTAISLVLSLSLWLSICLSVIWFLCAEVVREELADLSDTLTTDYEFRASFHRADPAELEVSDITKILLGMSL
jgi:hypothetical protein